MFNLEQAIVEWRQRMLAAGIKTPVPLEELESHLREEIQRLMPLGLEAHQAFEISVQRIGEPQSLKSEFKKNEGNVMKQRFTIGVGIIGLLLGTMMILPALGRHKERNRVDISAGENFFAAGWAKDELYGLAWGTTLFLGGTGMAILGFRRRIA